MLLNGRTQNKINFEGVGESEFVNDIRTGIIPVISEGDSEEVKECKRRFIRKKLSSLRSMHQSFN